MKVALLVVGLVIGAAVGWLTAPAPTAEMQIGPVKVEVDQDKGGGTLTASDGGKSMEIAVGDQSVLGDRNLRTAIFAAGGGVIGLVLGFIFGRPRRA